MKEDYLRMKQLEQNLYITYSNQRARDLKANGLLNPLDKVITLEQLILELYEQNNFEFLIDDALGTSIVYNVIQENSIEYFTYLESDAGSLGTMYAFMLKCHRNDVAFSACIEGTKLSAMEQIDTLYQAYKKQHNLADSADVEDVVLSSWDDDAFLNTMMFLSMTFRWKK